MILDHNFRSDPPPPNGWVPTTVELLVIAGLVLVFLIGLTYLV